MICAKGGQINGQFPMFEDEGEGYSKVKFLYKGDKLIRRGLPRKEKKKVPISIRLSEHVLEAFKRCGPGWQTRMDEALEQWLEEHPEQDTLTVKAPSGRDG